MATLPSTHPVRLQVRALARGGDLETAIASAKLYKAEHGLAAIPMAAWRMVLTGLKRNVPPLMLALGLAEPVDGGAAVRVHDLDQIDPERLAALVAGEKLAGASSDREREAARLRQQRRRERQRGGQAPPSTPAPPSMAPPASRPVTPSVTGAVTTPVTPPEPTDVTGVTGVVTTTATEPVTAPVVEVFPENSAASTATATTDVTPPSRARADLDRSDLKDEIKISDQSDQIDPPASAPGHALGAEESELVERVVEAWKTATGRPAEKIRPRDLRQLRRRVALGATWEQFHAILMAVRSEPWFRTGDGEQCCLALLCSDKFFGELVEKGRAHLASLRPPSTPTLAFSVPRPAAPPPAAPPGSGAGLARTSPPASAPSAPAPELIPFSAYPTHGRQRVFFAHDRRYEPCPERGGWLREDLCEQRRTA